MNAPAKVKPKAETVEQVLDEMDAKRAANLRIWNALGKTDPAHTKAFQRAGGFRGTAIKPIWITQRLTELFGPCGTGWGMGKPEFETVIATDGEVLVYCTVEGWYSVEDGKVAVVYGVGGDKCIAKQTNRMFVDDEAFKKAFTDALGNAFKFVGVGADVHMGLFEDSKYLAEVTAEFHPPEEPKQAEEKDRAEGDMSASALKGSIRMLVHNINGCATVPELEDLLGTDDAKEVMENCERRFPSWWSTGEGLPEEFVPLKTLIEQTRKGLKELEDA